MALLARLRPRDAARKKLKSRIQGTIVARPRSVSPVSPKVDHVRVDQEIGQIFARGRTCLRERFAIPLFEATHPTAHPLSLSNESVSCPTGRTTRLHTRLRGRLSVSRHNRITRRLPPRAARHPRGTHGRAPPPVDRREESLRGSREFHPPPRRQHRAPSILACCGTAEATPLAPNSCSRQQGLLVVH